jgi:transposase
MKRATTVSATPTSDPPAPDYILGLDVSKNTLDVVHRVPGGDRKTKSVLNDPDGFDALLQWLKCEANSIGRIHACLEASGGYEQPVARFLYGQGACVSVVNPRRLSAYAESQLRRSKTDRVDARLLTRFCEREQPDPWEPPDPDREALQELSRGLQSLKKERDRLKNQIDRTESEPVTEALTSVLEEVDEQIEALRDQLDEHVEASRPLRRERELLQTIPGVGRTAATQILAE